MPREVVPVAEEDCCGFRIASAYVAVGLDQTGLDAGISDLESKLAGIRDRAIGIGLDPAAVDAAIREIQARLDGLRGSSAGVGVSEDELDHAIAEIKAKLQALGADHVEIRIGTVGAQQATGELTGLAAVMRARWRRTRLRWSRRSPG
jgi:hypothetical protein